jgi:hypothetical protein
MSGVLVVSSKLLVELAPFEKRLQPFAARRMPQLAQRLRLDLPDALAGHREALADFLEGVLGATLSVCLEIGLGSPEPHRFLTQSS